MGRIFGESALSRWQDIFTEFIFKKRQPLLFLFAGISCFFIYSATSLKVDSGFEKNLPLEHSFIKNFLRFQENFGGANRILVAMSTSRDNIFYPHFFEEFKKLTDDIYFLPNIDRGRMKSIFTPNVRYLEITDEGFAGAAVVPANFTPTAENLSRVKTNIFNSHQIGHLVANDFKGAMISASLYEKDPRTGKNVDISEIAKKLDAIKDRYSQADLKVHIIGYSKFIGDFLKGANEVSLFFLVTIFISIFIIYFFFRRWCLVGLVIFGSILAVIWQLGLLAALGYGIDPLSMLVPFLIFAISLSHSVQMISGIQGRFEKGLSLQNATKKSFRALLLPGIVALISDSVGFLSLLSIDLGIIRSFAISASLGIFCIIFIDLLLLPLIIFKFPDSTVCREEDDAPAKSINYEKFRFLTSRKSSATILILSSGLFLLGFYLSRLVPVGDIHSGAPEFHRESDYNIDTSVITSKFSIGIDMLSIIAEAPPNSCIDYDIMNEIQKLTWRLSDLSSVQSATSLPIIASIVNSAWNEGSLKWKSLPKNKYQLAQNTADIDTSTGLLDENCGLMPIYVFAKNHKSETIKSLISEVQAFKSQQDPQSKVKFHLASGNLGIMAATNEVVEQAELPMLFYVFSIITLLCWWLVRSFRVVLCIAFPLALVTILNYVLMYFLEIGIKPFTLPVIALGVGIGVDYGIYIFHQLSKNLKKGFTLEEAYIESLRTTGRAVLLTTSTLACGVLMWIFSPLKFQADMGILLFFLFIFNMLGAVLIGPAIARLLNLDSKLRS